MCFGKRRRKCSKMIEVANTSIRHRILSFFEIKEGLIKSVSGRSYLDYVHDFFLPIAFIIAFFTDDYYFFEYRTSFAFSLWILFGIVWAIVIRLLFKKKDKVHNSMNSGNYLDLSIYKKQLIIYRILAATVFCAMIGLIVYMGFIEDYNFEVDDLFGFIFCFWVLIISGGYVISDDNKTIQIIKIDLEKLRVAYKKEEKYILLNELKEIKIAGTHLSFFPKEGKIEMLNDLELDEEEQLRLRTFLNDHLSEIPVSIYETRLEVFNNNNQED